MIYIFMVSTWSFFGFGIRIYPYHITRLDPYFLHLAGAHFVPLACAHCYCPGGRSNIYPYFTFILLKFPSFPFVFLCHSDVPLISLSVRLIFLLIFLSCPFHFTLLSLQFPSLFPSSHAVFLVCPVILGRKIEFPRMFVSFSFHSPWFFIFFHARLCFFSIL